MAIEKIQSDANISGPGMDLGQHERDISALMDAADGSPAGGGSGPNTDNPAFNEGLAAAVVGGPIAAGISIFATALKELGPQNNAQTVKGPQSLDSRFAGNLPHNKATAQPTPIVPLSYAQKVAQTRNRGITAGAARKGVPLGVRTSLTSMSL